MLVSETMCSLFVSSRCWLRRNLVLALTLLLSSRLMADTVLISADPAALAVAVKQGGTIKLAFDGIVALTNTLTILQDTTVDATGRAVSLDGGNAVRHFAVTNGMALRLINLTLTNGNHVGDTGEEGVVGHPGMGGSIYSSQSKLDLINCRFLGNRGNGGQGGRPSTNGIQALYGMAGGPAYGGAIFAAEGEVSVANCVFANNSCTGGQGTQGFTYSGGGGDAFGGALYSFNALVSLMQVRLTNNIARAGEISTGRASGSGGAAYGGGVCTVLGPTSIKGSVFLANQAIGARSYFEPQSGSANGGALYYQSQTVVIDGCLFAENAATGGGVTSKQGESTIAGMALGGAIFSGSREVRLSNSALVFNQARGGNNDLVAPWTTRAGDAHGGAIYSSRDGLLLINCTLAHNKAKGGDAVVGTQAVGGWAFGGAIAGPVSLLNVTLSENSVQFGLSQSQSSFFQPPAGRGGSSVAGNGFITNSILACAGGQTNVSGTLIDGGHNICSDVSASFTSSTSRNNLDPLLGSLAYHGGPTPTMPLLPASSAIDAGDDSVASATDQRGVQRKGLASDIGAFELAPSISLSAGQQGKVRVDYHFQAVQTNQVSASTNFLAWESLGIKIADTNGTCELEQVEQGASPIRFYRVQGEPAR